MGFAAGRSMTYARGRAKESLARLSGNVGAFRQAVAAGATPLAAQRLTDFTADRRADAAE